MWGEWFVLILMVFAPCNPTVHWGSRVLLSQNSVPRTLSLFSHYYVGVQEGGPGDVASLKEVLRGWALDTTYSCVALAKRFHSVSFSLPIYRMGMLI